MTTSEANDKRHLSHRDSWWMDRCSSSSMWLYCTCCPASSARPSAANCSCRVWWSRRTCQRRTERFRLMGCTHLQPLEPNVLNHPVHLSALKQVSRGKSLKIVPQPTSKSIQRKKIEICQKLWNSFLIVHSKESVVQKPWVVREVKISLVI